MSYIYFGGTRGVSIERDRADREYLRKHGGPKALAKAARLDAITYVLIFLCCAALLGGIIALVVFVAQYFDFNFWALLFNPITVIFLPVALMYLECNK